MSIRLLTCTPQGYSARLLVCDENDSLLSLSISHYLFFLSLCSNTVVLWSHGCCKGAVALNVWRLLEWFLFLCMVNGSIIMLTVRCITPWLLSVLTCCAGESKNVISCKHLGAHVDSHLHLEGVIFNCISSESAENTFSACVLHNTSNKRDIYLYILYRCLFH